MKISSKKVKDFNQKIWQHYNENGRGFAWRNTTDPYHILVSEIMLQQTQTSRVTIKYESFLKKFPSASALSKASLPEVLHEWQGLGYNRRALYLKKCAETITVLFDGVFPDRYENLLKLPGIGQSTAGALMAFSFNKAVPFIETNIRTVFIYFFLSKSSSVSDTMILDLIEQTIDIDHPREWYYALYDYGAMLKSKNKEFRTIHQKSSHYKKQTKFEGSNRQLRSHILKTILSSPTHSLTLKGIQQKIKNNSEAVEKNLIKMQKEELLILKDKLWSLA